jgi:hypothetical protein
MQSPAIAWRWPNRVASYTIVSLIKGVDHGCDSR